MECLNCCHLLQKEDKYCPECGQKVTSKKIPVKQFISDFLGDYFTWDSKFIKSIVPLLIKPGFLSKEYVEGKRMGYIPPLRMFIFSSILFLLFLNFDELDNELKNDIVDGNAIDSALVVNDKDDNQFTLNFGKDYKLNWDSLMYHYNKRTFRDYVNQLHFKNTGEAEISYFGYLTLKQLTKFKISGGSGMGDFLKSSLSKIMFISLPAIAFLLMVIIGFNNTYFFEHFVFSLHIYTFFFVIFILAEFIERWLFDISVVTFIIFLGYLFLALKNFYNFSFKKAIFKYVLLLLTGSLILFPVFFISWLILSFIIY